MSLECERNDSTPYGNPTGEFLLKSARGAGVKYPSTLHETVVSLRNHFVQRGDRVRHRKSKIGMVRIRPIRSAFDRSNTFGDT